VTRRSRASDLLLSSNSQPSASGRISIRVGRDCCSSDPPFVFVGNDGHFSCFPPGITILLASSPPPQFFLPRTLFNKPSSLLKFPFIRIDDSSRAPFLPLFCDPCVVPLLAPTAATAKLCSTRFNRRSLTLTRMTKPETLTSVELSLTMPPL